MIIVFHLYIVSYLGIKVMLAYSELENISSGYIVRLWRVNNLIFKCYIEDQIDNIGTKTHILCVAALCNLDSSLPLYVVF